MSAPSCCVSVVVPLYNSASTLPRAVQSVLQQSLKDIELLVVDDASRDHSLAEARKLATMDARIRVIALPVNRGKSHAMNRGIAEAQGTWVAVLDADDWYEPTRLATLVSTAETERVQLIADNQRFWDAGAGEMVRTAFPATDGNRSLTSQQFIAGSDPYADFDYGMLKPVVLNAWIRQTGLAYRESARLSEDFLYLFDFFSAGGSGFLVGEPLYNWTQSFGTISREWTTTGAGDWRYDYKSALAAYADVLRTLDKQEQQQLAGLLVTRMRAFQRLHDLSAVNRLRKSGAGLWQVLAEAARHPSIWPQLTLRLLRK